MKNQLECHQILFSIEESKSEANRNLEEAGYKIMAPKLMKTVNQRYETGTTKAQNQAGPEITLIPLFDPSKGISEDDFLENVTRDIRESLLNHSRSRQIAVTYSRDGFPNELSFKGAIERLINDLRQIDPNFNLVSYSEE
jgi:hypothetical protein